MDWTAVKKDTPKAFNKFVKWIDAESTDILQFELMMILKNERNLYDFFDEQGIYIGLVIGNNNMGESQPPIFEYEILQGGEAIHLDSDCHSSRNKAETAAFTRAWQILEKQ